MRISYLILNHQEPSATVQLVEKLASDDVSFFVHVDAKADETPLRRALPGAVFIKDRVSINWCGFGMVEAVFQLLKAAHISGADRFVLLSGSDYPIKSRSVIREKLIEDREYIQVDRCLDAAGDSQFDRCANRFFLGNHFLTNPRTGHRRIVRIAEHVSSRLLKRDPGFPIYYGASWWSLTRAAVDYILHVWRHEPQIVSWFRYARSPDEMVFQTLIKASPRANHIAYDVTMGHKPALQQAALHYVDFDRPNPEVPRTLDESDYIRIVASDALFMRKIDNRSSSLLAMIDAKVAAA